MRKFPTPYFFFWLFLIAAFAVIVSAQTKNQSQYTDQTVRLQWRLGELNQEAETLSKQIQDAYSDENVEKQARKLLRLVYPDEIVIYNDGQE
ncbi:MAG: septum formation initiator family protein [Clostridiales bacterium]|jgi:cell division protein FtsB|nr:septum formation initiator family protein [Clostridiales bacterium]